jgi:hypothetical protein
MVVVRKYTFTVLAATVLGLAVAVVWAPSPVATQALKAGVQVWSVDVPCEYALALVQGASSKSGLLLDEGCIAASKGNKYIPDLVLRKADDGQVTSRIVVHDWPGFVKERQGQFFPGSNVTRWFNAGLDPAFQFLYRPGFVLMKDSPWLAVVDLQNGAIIRSALPSPDLTDPNSPALHVPLCHPVPMIVSVAHDQGTVAVASNIGTSPRMFIFNSDLTRQLRSWPLTRYVKSLAWSPDGKRVGVLYDGKFDGSGKYVGQFPQWMPVRLADISLFDAVTGKELLKFFTGGPESQIVFSHDGQVIYTISEMSNVTSLQKDALRVFSSHTGVLVRVIAPNGPHLHDEFAVSPDGRFIAADASSELGHPFWTEPVAFSNVSRVVVLDSKTGKVLFSRERKTGTAAPLNPIFTPDGRLLIVQYGPYLSAKGKQRATIHIVAYSLPSG